MVSAAQVSSLRKYLKVALVLVGIALAVYARYLRIEKNSEADATELVKTIRLNGHQYDLFFHRKAKYYNSIKRDGVVVFDGKNEEEAGKYIQDISARDGVIYRHYYDNEKRQELVYVALP